MENLNTQRGDKNLCTRVKKKRIKYEPTKYKYVRKHTDTSSGAETYVGIMGKDNLKGFSWCKALPATQENLRKLAKMVDIKLIKAGKQPVNILKKT